MSDMEKGRKEAGFEDVVKGMLLMLRSGLVSPSEAKHEIMETLRAIRKRIIDVK